MYSFFFLNDNVYIGWYCCGLSFCRTLFWLGIPSRFTCAKWFAFVSASSARTAIANSAPWIVLCPTGHLGPLVHHFARAQQRGHSQTELMTQNQCFCFWTGPFSLLYFMLGRPQSEGLFAATWSTIWAKFHICWANCKTFVERKRCPPLLEPVKSAVSDSERPGTVLFCKNHKMVACHVAR